MKELPDYEVKRCATCGAWIPSVATMCASCGSSHVDEGAAAPPSRQVRLSPRSRRWSATSVLIGVNVAFYLWSLYVSKVAHPRSDLVKLVLWGPDFSPDASGDRGSSPLALVGVYWHDAVAHGEWWRLVAALFLHGGIIHIGFNMRALSQLGEFAEQIFGPRRFIVVYVVTGLCSMGAISVWYVLILGQAGAPPTVGASGAIFGIGGLLVSFLWRRGTERGRQIARSLGLNLLFILGLGLIIPIISNTGHVGGMLPGLAFGLFLKTGFTERVGAKADSRWTLLAALCCAVFAVGLGFAIANVFQSPATPFR